jgi:hypothetical protein
VLFRSLNTFYFMITKFTKFLRFFRFDCTQFSTPLFSLCNFGVQYYTVWLSCLQSLFIYYFYIYLALLSTNYFTKFLKSGSTPLKGLSLLNDSYLVFLHDAIPCTIIQDIASYTRNKYCYAFATWSKWAASHHVYDFPASGELVALYLMHLTKSQCGMGSLISLV